MAEQKRPVRPGKRRRRGPRPKGDPNWCVDPVWATVLLLDHMRFGPRVADPCCGMGNVSKALALFGYGVVSSDKIDRGLFDGLRFTANFLEDEYPLEDDAYDYVFNPPYGRGVLAEQFIDQALERCKRYVAALVNDSFLYSAGYWSGKRGSYGGGRHDRFCGDWPLALIVHLSSRPSMPPGEELVKGTLEPEGGMSNYLWLVFDREWPGGDPATRWARLPVAKMTADQALASGDWTPVPHYPQRREIAA